MSNGTFLSAETEFKIKHFLESLCNRQDLFSIMILSYNKLEQGRAQRWIMWWR